MFYAIDVPNHGEYSDPHVLLDLAMETEVAGWDGFFIWDHIVKYNDASLPVADPWVALSAIAVHTKRIRFGPMVTPLARRRPWKLARETVTLDHLSKGRLILGVGLGARSKAEFEVFGDERHPVLRAQMLDEALDILAGLWSGEPFNYQGTHYSVRETQFRPKPRQTPRIPIWVAGTWPHKKPLQRAALWDGYFPIGAGHSQVDMLSVTEMSDAIAYLKDNHLLKQRFDIVHLGITPINDPDQGAKIAAQYAKAGVTWWLENINLGRCSLAEARQRILMGPPK
jgi:alkanesulfonate monooxygenase SsuD/methylene tetrahydromethanopterin reductase-like flavin-dependent oxidoreductase (luciferase family)